jgi:hypothetical protein
MCVATEFSARISNNGARVGENFALFTQQAFGVCAQTI